MGLYLHLTKLTNSIPTQAQAAADDSDDAPPERRNKRPGGLQWSVCERYMQCVVRMKPVFCSSTGNKYRDKKSTGHERMVDDATDPRSQVVSTAGWSGCDRPELSDRRRELNFLGLQSGAVVRCQLRRRGA